MALAGALAAVAFNIGEDALALGEFAEISTVDILSAVAPLPGVQTFAKNAIDAWEKKTKAKYAVDYTPLLLAGAIIALTLI